MNIIKLRGFCYITSMLKILLPFLMVLVGCSGTPRPAQSYSAPYGARHSSAYEEERDAAPVAEVQSSFKMASAGQAMPLASPKARAKRMVFNEGWITLRSTEPGQTMDNAAALATRSGGFVESRNTFQLVLRIPVDSFRIVFERLTLLATLVSKEIRAEDITEQFMDTELRLRIAKETLERLQTLLAESKDSEEKLRLLAEIQRLSQQIELDEARKRDLSKKAAFSRVTLQVHPFLFTAEGDEPIQAFRWIQNLNPTRSNEFLQAKPLKLAVPKGFVDLELDDNGRPWVASASNASELWARKLKNSPEGNSTFWIETLRIRLEKSFAKADTASIGNWKYLILRSFGERPYTWMVAVSTESKYLYLAEAFFPSDDAKDAHFQRVLEAFKEAKP